MKRMILICALCALLLLTVGCSGEETPAPADGGAGETTTQPAAEPAEEDASATGDETAPENAAATVEEQIALVQSMIDEPIDRLYETIGQPLDSAYASSCLGQGEDGELYYDGFTVYTYRDTDGSESVYDVMPDAAEAES